MRDVDMREEAISPIPFDDESIYIVAITYI